MEEKEFSEDKIIESILKYNNNIQVQELRDFYYNKSFPEILAVGRRELSHSSFLAWLFDSKSNHNLDSFPIMQLLEVVLLRCRRQHSQTIDINVTNAILSKNISFSHVTVKTEYSVQFKNKRGRVDLVVDCDTIINDSETKKIRIVIENKVLSSEHDNQTKTYFDFFEKNKSKNELIFYIYLTPQPSIEMNNKNHPDCDCEYFTHINYQDILDYILQPSLQRPNLSDRTKFLLTEYIHSLSIPFEDDKNKKNIIMAISENERKLLTAFWENNETLIIAAMNAIATDSNQDQDIVDSVSKASSYLNNSKRDYSKFSINNEGKYTKRGLVFAIVNKYLKINPSTSISMLKEIFPDTLQGSLGVIKDCHDNINDYTRYSESEHPESKEKFYICNQWGGQIVDFINHINNMDSIELHISKI